MFSGITFVLVNLLIPVKATCDNTDETHSAAGVVQCGSRKVSPYIIHSADCSILRSVL